MRAGLRLGLVVEHRAVVKPWMKPHLEGMVRHPLYSTWAMVYHMEVTARKLLAPYLEPTEEAVGAGVLVKHLRPARIGSAVHIVGTLVRIKGSSIYTRLEVFTKNRKIGEGSHQQVVMARSRFAQLLQEARGRGETN
jgi:predicted thioesterase